MAWLPRGLLAPDERTFGPKSSVPARWTMELGTGNVRRNEQSLRRATMSQCHDTYDRDEREVVATGRTTGVTSLSAPCHDLYETNAPAMTHPGCRLVGCHLDGVQTIVVEGRVDWTTQRQFRDFMTTATEPEVVVDLSAATMDSAGTGVLLAWVARARRRSQGVVVVCSDPLQHEVLFAVGLDSVVPIVTSEREALNWSRAHRASASAD
jgi:anti-anti-sigma factor